MIAQENTTGRTGFYSEKRMTSPHYSACYEHESEGAWGDMGHACAECLRSPKPSIYDDIMAGCRERIAKELAVYFQVEARVRAVAFAQLPKSVQDRCIRLADRVTRELDPTECEADKKSAVAELEEHYNGPFMGRGTQPSITDIANNAIAIYEATRARSPR